MKKLIISFMLLLVPVIIIAQDLRIQNNVYDRAEDNIQNRNSLKRERWFYEQRMYPNNFIPDGAYEKAENQRNELRSSNGFQYDRLVSWLPLGPTPGNYPNYGNISSRITTAVYDPVNPNTIYIGAAFGGVWKSTDSGLNWTAKTDNEISLSSGALAIDPSNNNIIYYGTGEATYSSASYYGRGLLKSTNGGDNWTSYRNGLPSGTYFSRLVIQPGNSSYLLAALGTGGLYKSTNAGLNWSQVITGRCDDVVYSPDGTKAYVTGSGTGYMISVDGGVIFTTGTFPVAMGTRNHIAICKSAPLILYVSKYSGSTISIYKSTDGGLNFSQVSTGFNFNGSQAWYDFYMHVNPFDPDCAYVGAVDIFRTIDGGVSFANITNSYNFGNVHADQHNVAFHPTDTNKMICVCDGGIWISSDRGTTWINRNAGLTLTQFYRIASDPGNPSNIAGGTQDNGTQMTFGTSEWSAVFGGDGGEVCFNPKSPNYVLGEMQNNFMMRSDDGGYSWHSGTGGLFGTSAFVAPIIAHPDSSGIFYTATSSLFKTVNNGANWSSISSGLVGVVRILAISKSNANVIFASIGSVVYKSSNRGYTFDSTNTGLPIKTVTSINVHPDSSDVAIVTYSGFGGSKVYKTTNGGTSWFSILGNLPDTPVNDGFIFHPGFSTSVYYLATDVGVYTSTNWGANWTEIADGLPNTVAMHLDYNNLTGKLRVGTHGRGVYELSSPLTGICNYSNSVPTKYYLSQNYPNPFNPVTKISFAIERSGFVTLKVYDCIGKAVSELVNQYMNEGRYEYTFRGDKLNSGVYFYKLTADGYSETKRMMLIK
ncbi:MAG: T9SS type A sorting domain-containing protein [Ignavibacteriota bacterium]